MLSNFSKAMDKKIRRIKIDLEVKNKKYINN